VKSPIFDGESQGERVKVDWIFDFLELIRLPFQGFSQNRFAHA